MKKVITTWMSFMLAMAATAQNYYYQLDATFHQDGLRTFTASGADAGIRSGYLNQDGSMVLAGYGSGYNAYMKLKSNGDLDSTLCGSYCVSAVGMSTYPLQTFKVGGSNAGYYTAHEGWGGVSIPNSNLTTIDFQIYSGSIVGIRSACQFDDSTIVSVGESRIFAFRPGSVGSGYASGGSPNLITNCTYPGGEDYIANWNNLTNVNLTAVARTNDGKLLVSGTGYDGSTNTDYAFICRRLTNGLEIDSSFGTNGMVQISATSSAQATVQNVTVDPLTGIIYWAKVGSLYALQPNGSKQTNFGSNGELNLGSYYVYNIAIHDGILYCATAVDPANYNSTAIIAYQQTNGLPAKVFYGWIATEPPAVPYKSFKHIFEPVRDSLIDPSYFNTYTSDIEMNSNGDIALFGVISPTSGANQIASVMKLKKVNFPTSVHEVNANNQLIVYPNPVSDVLTVSNHSNNIEIYNLFGQLLIESTKQQIDVSMLPKGTYIIKSNQHIAKFHKL